MSDFNIDPNTQEYFASTFDASYIDPAGGPTDTLQKSILDYLHDTLGVGKLKGRFGVPDHYPPEGKTFAQFVIDSLPPNMLHEDIVKQLDLRTFAKALQSDPSIAPEAAEFATEHRITARLTEHYAKEVVDNSFANVSTSRSNEELQQAVINDTVIGTVPEVITLIPMPDDDEMRATVFGIEPSAETPSANDPASEPGAMGEALPNFDLSWLDEERGPMATTETTTVSIDDFTTLFTFDDTFASAAQLFNDYQLNSILGLDQGAIQQYKFRWTEDVPPTERMAAQGVTMNLLELRKMLRTMEPKHVAALSDKLAIAGYYERVGAEGPLIDGNGNDVVFQRAVSELVYDSVAQGGAAITTVLNNQLQQRLGNVNQKFREASLTGLQQQVMEYGTYVLGRPLTPEQAMEAIRSLPEFRETYVEEQLAAGVTEETILAAPAELDDAESSQLLQYVYDANKREAQRFGANNWAGLFADEAKRRKAGAQSGRELPFGVAEGTRAQDITVGDVTGDSGD